MSVEIQQKCWYIRWYRASTNRAYTNMALTELAIRSAKVEGKITKLSDRGGLQLWVTGDGAKRWRLDVRLERLTPKLAQLLRVAAAVSPSVQGPPHVFLRERFRTIVYLRHLFERGRLKGIANRPPDPA